MLHLPYLQDLISFIFIGILSRVVSDRAPIRLNVCLFRTADSREVCSMEDGMNVWSPFKLFRTPFVLQLNEAVFIFTAAFRFIE